MVIRAHDFLRECRFIRPYNHVSNKVTWQKSSSEFQFRVNNPTRPDINMSPARQRKELTEFQKGGIVALSHDKNPPEIGNDLHIPR